MTTREQRELARQVLADEADNVSRWGLPSAIEDAGELTEAEYVGALDAVRAELDAETFGGFDVVRSDIGTAFLRFHDGRETDAFDLN